VGLLAEFYQTARPTLRDMAQIEREKSKALDGRTIDIRTAADLRPRFGDDEMRMAEVWYAADDERRKCSTRDVLVAL